MSDIDPLIVIHPVTPPADMDEEERATLRAVAEAEAQSALRIRDTVVSEMLTIGRWLQASLLVVNGGAAAAALSSSDVEPWARFLAGTAFVTGISLALLTGLLSIWTVQASPRKLSEFAGYWISVQYDLLRSVEVEREFATWSTSFMRRSQWIYVPGGFSLVAFVVGAIVLGFGAK